MVTVNMASETERLHSADHGPQTSDQALQPIGHASEPTGHASQPTDHSPRTSGHTPLSSGHASPSAGHASPSTGPTHYPLGPAPRTSGHAPRFSVSHPMIPRFYVLPWKQDMKNQRLLLQNAALAQIPLRPLEESLCLCSRERLCHAQKTPLRPHPSPGLSPGPGPSPSPGPDLVQSGLRAHHSSQFSRYNSSVFTTRGLYTPSR